MSFTPVLTQAVIAGIYSAVQDFALQSGLFTSTEDHEGRNAPGQGLSCQVLMGTIEPVRASGLNATSARMEFTVRVSAPRMQTPDGATDQAVMYVGAYLIGAFTNDFDVDELEPEGLVREIDVLGAHGDALKFEPGWLAQDGSPYRVGELTLPLILNDVFPQGA